MTKKIIEAKELSFKYSENIDRAIEKVSFSINEGEIVFITGNSGSGKSTILNIINGMIPEVTEGELKGELFIDGKKDLPTHERSLIVGNVFQNPRSQFFTTNTTSELVFEMENYGFSKNDMDYRLNHMVEEFNVKQLMNKEIFSISSGERQLLALLTALIINPKVIIFDEPSANLDYGNAMRLKREIQNLKVKGKTVIIADHRCFYLKGIIDKVLLVENNTIKEFDSEEAFLNCDYGKRVFDLFSHDFDKRHIVKSNKPFIEAKDISYQGVLKDVKLKFNLNEVSAIVGINGVGKTTLARILSKIIKADNGEVKGSEQPLYIMQDADFQLFGSSCLKELEITQKNEEININALKLLNLWHLKDKHPQTLSGGEKQRLQMAISMVSQNKVIIMDEPTSGLDKNSMNKVIEMIEILKKDRAVILISHDYEFIRNVADKIIYIKNAGIEDNFYLTNDNIEKLNEIYKEMEKCYE